MSSLGDIWGATDTETDPNAINVPQDPVEAYKAGLLMGITQNCDIVIKWVKTLITDGMSLANIYSELNCDADDLAACLDRNAGYYLDRTDKLTNMARFCQMDLKMRKIVSGQV